jgi:hypothetical protein
MMTLPEPLLTLTASSSMSVSAATCVFTRATFAAVVALSSPS